MCKQLPTEGVVIGRTVVSTGTASGIGRATVSRFSSEGWNVVATVRQEQQDISQCALEDQSSGCGAAKPVGAGDGARCNGACHLP